MKQVRLGVFETNSSSTHSFSIHIGDSYSIACYDECERDDVYLEDSDIDDILDSLPIERLENAIKRNQRREEVEKLRESYETQISEIKSIHCVNCTFKNCHMCDVKNKISEIENKIYALY